jgi:hypothetical protein
MLQGQPIQIVNLAGDNSAGSATLVPVGQSSTLFQLSSSPPHLIQQQPFQQHQQHNGMLAERRLLEGLGFN